jgi:hypothetical protein
LWLLVNEQGADHDPSKVIEAVVVAMEKGRFKKHKPENNEAGLFVNQSSRYG